MTLERNLIDNILECEIKLGHASTSIRFYYPIQSLLELLGCDQENLNAAIQTFQQQQTDRLGMVMIEELPREKGRFQVSIPASGVNWVHEHYHPSEFMKSFVTEIHRPGTTLETMLNLFHRYSADVEVRKVEENEWSVYFTDETIDPYIYHIEENPFGLEYHRFTKTAYQNTLA